MAFINPDDHSGSVGQIAPDSIQNNATTTAQNIVISPMGLTEVPLPGGGFVTNAVMTQEGADLILESPDGITLVIEGYFSGDAPPNLVSDGKVLTPALVKSFIQASAEYAEDTVAMNDVTPVGQVQEVSGTATVTHLDGTKEAIAKGTAIYEGDVVETDAKGAVNIEFVDESSFAVSNNAKMAIDEFVFDAKTQGGENNFSVLRGLFVYTSGLVGREDPDDVKIETPVGSIGIRGTIITGSIPAEGSLEAAKISVVEGAIVIHAHNGADMTLSKQFETVEIDTKGTMSNVGVLPQSDMIQTFNVLRTVAPTLFSAMEEAQQEGAQSPSEDAAPVDAPADVKEAAPTEEAPAQEPAPAQPEALPDVIHLNLLPGALDPVSLDNGIAAQDSGLQAQTTIAVAGLALPTFMSGASAAPLTTQTTPVDTTATTPNVDSTGQPVDLGGGGNVGHVNTAPVAALTTYTALEQPGVTSSTHSFDIGHFFSDADGDTLSYTITLFNDPNNVITAYNVDATGLLTYTVSATTPTLSTVTFMVNANDGAATSTNMAVSLNVYNATATYSMSDDAGVMVTAANARAVLLAGNDDATVNAANTIVFGGGGNDSVTIFSGASGNKAFGEDGNDTINILGGVGNTASGGADDDAININLTTAADGFNAFGGSGNDVITLNNTAALASLTAAAGLIDGGTGYDTLAIGMSAGPVDLIAIPSSALIGIEKVKTLATGATSVTLDLNDLFGMDNNSIYLDIASNHSVTVTNSTAQGALTLQAGQVTDVDGETYNIYSNGTMTLYLSQDANLGNVTGAGIVV